MSSYIPYNDFRVYCRENWDTIYALWQIFRINWNCQTKNIYKRFAQKLESLKNVCKLIAMYQELSTDGKLSEAALGELRESSYHVVKVFGNLEKASSTIKAEILHYKQEFPLFRALVMANKKN